MNSDYPSADEVARGLEKYRKSGDGWMACCPAHADKNPSLSISEKHGRLLWHCFAGCSQEDVQQELISRGLLRQRNERQLIRTPPPDKGLTPEVTQKQFMLDEISVGEAYANGRHDCIRYDHTRHKWYRWNNFHWEQDKIDRTLWEGSRFTKTLFDGCEKPGKPTMKFVTAMLERASVETGIGVTSEVWDRHDWLLGTPHDTIDLRTGDTVKRNSSDLISKSAGVDPHGDCKRWQLFIKEITQDDAELALYLQKIAGYCLTGLVREQALFFLYGPGGNGKSVFLEAMAYVMGDYAVTTPAETFAG